MKTITTEQASENLKYYIDYTLDIYEEIIISSPKGSIVIEPEDDYEFIQEAPRILSDKKSLKALMDDHYLSKTVDERLKDNEKPVGVDIDELLIFPNP